MDYAEQSQFHQWLVKTQAQLDAVKQQNSRIRALISPPSLKKWGQAKNNYQSVLRSSLLQGMTVSIKDNIDTADAPTTAGAAFWCDRRPKKDAVVVSRLQSAGGVVFGKANMTELAWGVRSYSAVGGQCVNPLDEQRIAGGSSGGSAAAVVAGFCDASLGTDTGGSVRIPAAFCGLIGLRPTYGTIPNTGVLPLSHSHDTVGILGRNAVDVGRIYTAIAGPCPLDMTSNHQRPSAVLNQMAVGVKGLHIGIPNSYYFDYCTPQIANAVMRAARVLEEQGAILVSIHVPKAEQAQAMAACMMSSEVTALYEARLLEQPETISADVRERMMQALEYKGTDYARALAFKRFWQWQLAQTYQEVDVMMMPTTATTAPLLSDQRSLLEATKDLARNTYPSAMAGIPSMSVPVGFDSNKLPIGALLEAAWGREDLLLRCAYVLELDNKTRFSRLQ